MRIKNLNDAIGYNRSARVYRNSATYKFVNWLVDNIGVEFDIHTLGDELGVTSAAISASMRNTKDNYGFIFEMRKMPGAHQHQFYHKLVDCKFKKPEVEVKKKKKPSQSMWNVALSI